MGKITFFHSRRRVPMGKILLIMRLSIVLLLISFHVSAKNFAQNFITLQVTETKLTAALKKIERNSSFRFYYSDDVLPKDKLVNLSVNNADINDVLKLMLEGTSLSWKMLDGNRVVIGRFAALSQNNFQQSVSGVIRDQQGNPLEGVY
ncbi:MAG TPA: STN domain-containing protein, partial [Flavihumibacter sp.]